MASLYIHIPFCKRRCNYCDFYKASYSAGCEPPFLAALQREAELHRDFFGETGIDTLFLGGGTPSVLSPAAVGGILRMADSLWGLGSAAEITMEANPDDITPGYIDALAREGINRISFGVQSFIDRDLRLMGRRHDARQAAAAVAMARAAGFRNISIDLIFGIPGMTDDEWASNVERAISLGVDHISAYCLTIAEGTRFGDMESDGTLVPATDEACERQYLTCHKILTGAGFRHYEISNYAASDNFRSAHNMAYWNGSRYLGLGPSAHSYDGRHRTFSAADLAGYIQWAGTDRIYTTEVLSEADRYNEYIMTALRTDTGVNCTLLSDRLGKCWTERFTRESAGLLAAGLLAMNHDGGIVIPPEKWMVSNDIISDLFAI